MRLAYQLFALGMLQAWPALVAAQFEPPPSYYSSASGTGLALKNSLHNIIDGHIIRSYGDARDALQLLDEDPDDPTRVIQIYSGISVPGVWDSGVTWNREHQWPRSRGIDTSGADSSDLFNLRPANPSVNSSRGNKPYGIGAAYWDPAALAMPGVNDRGDCSRSMFYMAVRYDGSDSSTTDLELAPGFPGTNEMGDLDRMLEWHYSDPVDDIELRRNHLIWSSADNPQYRQGNRNPFIDHPEYVWAIWGPMPNDSTLYVGGDLPSNGASAMDVELRVLVGSPAPPAATVQLSKSGTAPTTFEVLAVGDAELFDDVYRLAFPWDPGVADIVISWPDTASVAAYAATLTIDNTDRTSAGTGQGSADGDDVVDVSVSVLDHAEASFDAVVNQDGALLDFGLVSPGEAAVVLDFDIHNLEAFAGLTADLRITAVSGSGDDDLLTIDVSGTEVIAGGGSLTFSATFDPAGADGAYHAVYTIEVADEVAPGAQAGTPLTLTLLGEIGMLGCGTFDDCADLDHDNVRDDNCVWWACDAGTCLGSDIVFADMGGSNGACAPDGTADANDRFHALNCFSDLNTLGGKGYECEGAPPTAFNVDAGGEFGGCSPDGVCDGHDAFHALNAFAGSNTCSCPGTGPAPAGAALTHRNPQPLIVASTSIALEPRRSLARPGDVVDVDLYLRGAVSDLRGYQLHLAAPSLELLDIAIEPRKDHVYHGLGYWTAFNVATAQMVAGLDGPGVAAPAGAYLATLSFRIPQRGGGPHVIELLHDDHDPAQRSFLFPTPPMAKIEIGKSGAARIRVLTARRRS